MVDLQYGKNVLSENRFLIRFGSSIVGSHVLAALPGLDLNRGYVRFSFGKYNTDFAVDFAVNTLVGLYHKEGELV